MFLSKVATAIGSFVVKSFNTPPKIVAGILGMFAAVIDPAIPFLILCTFFVFIDCLSAWMLARRVARLHPEKSKGSKFRSEYASEIFNTLAIIWLLVLGGYWLDESVFTMFKVNLGNWIAGAFCLVQIVSILENCSSSSTSTWAIVIQKVLVDKTSRHLDFDISEMVKEAKEEVRRNIGSSEIRNDGNSEDRNSSERSGNGNSEVRNDGNSEVRNDGNAEDERKKKNRERARKAAETRRRNREKNAGKQN